MHGLEARVTRQPPRETGFQPVRSRLPMWNGLFLPRFQFLPAFVEGLYLFLGGVYFVADFAEADVVGEDRGVFHELLVGVEVFLGYEDFLFHLLELALLVPGEAFGAGGGGFGLGFG